MSFILVWIGTLGPLYFKDSRCLFGIFLAIMPMIGTILLLFIPSRHPWGIVAGTWLASSTAPPVGQAIALMGANVKGNTKKSVVGAVFFIAYSVGCTTGPQLWQDRDAPRYTKGCISSIVSWVCLVAAMAVFYVSGRRSNYKRNIAVQQQATSLGSEPVDMPVDSDHTERENQLFRYSL